MNVATSAAAGEVRYSVQGGLARVTLSNPGKLNAMSRHMWQQLRSVFESIQVNKDAGCVLFSGAPCGDLKSFSAGGDISEYPSFRFNEASLHDFHEIDVWGGLRAMLACDVPIVAQIDGACMGAGLEMASCCDVRIAGSSARFGAPIAKLGFPMAPKEAEIVIRAVGELTTREMLLEAAVLDAATLLQRGFLNRVVADAEVANAAMQSVNRILALAPQAARLNKQTFRGLNKPISGVFVVDAAINSIVDASVENPYAYADSSEHQEGISAFIAKRKPDWSKN
ncbi:MAG: enoyl-CoA hydratase/isomerase family protein [Burkholderiaceae bacterium]|nr:enoyl-CoA hydratase/isomerase family protein [Burkholderiaceae bacterium]